MKHVDADKAQAIFHDGQPLAPLDLREAGQFGEGHSLFAMPLPYSVLEQRIRDLVPRLTERILLIDNGDGIAERAASRLSAAGYRSLNVLAGGMPAWKAAGYSIYKGVNVPSKLLGELAEAIWHPDTISPDQLMRWKSEGRAFQIFDARPAQEYAKMRIPGARCMPNGELPHHVATLGLDAEVPVVINCAGRTRGIVGAIGLRLAGHRGPIHALANGTQGWSLAGLQLERDNPADQPPALGAAALAASRAAGDSILRRFGISALDATGADRMLRDDQRTTYLVDVRSIAEAQADPVQGALQAPGGQLVQATDHWLAVRHAQVILCCDTGLRSCLAAFWLRQMGYDAFVLPLAEARRMSPAPRATRIPTPPLGSIDAAGALATGAQLIDLRSSISYRAGHVAGAEWRIRPHLANEAICDPQRPVLLIAQTVEDAAFAALDLADAGVRSIRRIEGGHTAMREAGAVIEQSEQLPGDADCIDHLFFVHDRHDGNLEAARRYLAWETGLIAQLSPAEGAEFRLVSP